MPKASRQQPNMNELDVLAVAWRAMASGAQAVRLSDVHRALLERRAKKNEPEPAVSTVSTLLRALTAKGLLEEVAIDLTGLLRGDDDGVRARTRPVTRSPLTGYRPVCSQGEVLKPMFLDLVSAYPENERHRALLDLAQALGLSEDKIKKIEKLVESG